VCIPIDPIHVTQSAALGCWWLASVGFDEVAAKENPDKGFGHHRQ
jgi:hypothetical protein